MIPSGAYSYIFYAAVMVISFFLGIRLIFADDPRRDAWRSSIKRKIYFSEKSFKRWSVILGWLLLILSLVVAYYQILDLIEA